VLFNFDIRQDFTFEEVNFEKAKSKRKFRQKVENMK